LVSQHRLIFPGVENLRFGKVLALPPKIVAGTVPATHFSDAAQLKPRQPLKQNNLCD